jgi:hypothetical protein
MRSWLIVPGRIVLMGLALLAALLAPPATNLAWGRPMDGAQQQQLVALYHRYNQAIVAGHVEAALALRSAPVRTAVTQGLKTPKDRTDYLAAAAAMVPDRLELRHASINDAGDKALLIAWAYKTLATGQAQQEFDLSFVLEGGAWKLGDQEAGPGPDDIKRCLDPAGQPIATYDTGRLVSVAGRIERVDFQPDHTLVVVLSGATETCAFLPNRTALQQRGLDPSILEPYRIADISGAPNRTDPQKVMVNSITVHAEE